MRVYYGLVHVEPGSAWGVTFPDLPGCFSAADDEADIVAEAQTALALYASDRDAPLPISRSVAEIVAEVKADLKAGAFLIAVPLVEVTRKKRVNVMLDPETLAAADRCARIAGISRSEFLSDALAARVAETTGLARVGAGKRRKGGGGG